MKTSAILALLALASVPLLAQQRAAQKPAPAAKKAAPTTAPRSDDPPPEKFAITDDNIVVCKSRSIRALFKAVNAEHGGALTEQFASLRLRDEPNIAKAAAADTAACEKGSYIAAMEKALKAADAESARIRALINSDTFSPAAEKKPETQKPDPNAASK